MDVVLARSELRTHLGMSDTDLPPGDADLLLNRSIWSLTNTYPFRETELTKFINTIINQAKYSTPTLFDAIRNLSIEDPDTLQHTTLDRMELFDYENKFINTPDANGKPTHYLRENDCFRLWPTPDKIYKLTIKHWITLVDIDDSNPQFPLPSNWFEIVILGATWRGFLRLRNPTMAADVKNQQVAMIRDTKSVEGMEKDDSHMSGVSIAGYDPGNIYSSEGR